VAQSSAYDFGFELLGFAMGFRCARLAVLAAAVVLAAGATLVRAQELKIGYVNSERILRDSPQARAAMQKVDAEFAKRDKEVTEMGVRFKSAVEKFDKEAPVMPEAERARRQRELAESERDLQRRQRELREDYNQRRNEEMLGLSEKAQRIVRQIAEQENYDIILQDAVHVGPRVDITDRVLKLLANTK